MAKENEECLDAHRGDCYGKVEGHASLAGTGMRIWRCDKHYADALDRDAETSRRYPPHPPADFDYLDAGEYWYEDLSR